MDGVESVNDAAGKQWKTLHHQGKDLSPWLTEDIRAEHLRISNRGERSTSPPKYALTQIWTSVQRSRWKVLAVFAAICRLDTFSTATFRDLTYPACVKPMHSSGYPCLFTSKTTTERASAYTSPRNRNVQRLRGSRAYSMLQREQIFRRK